MSCIIWSHHHHHRHRHVLSYLVIVDLFRYDELISSFTILSNAVFMLFDYLQNSLAMRGCYGEQHKAFHIGLPKVLFEDIVKRSLSCEICTFHKTTTISHVEVKKEQSDTP